jgi:hypothetical protein
MVRLFDYPAVNVLAEPNDGVTDDPAQTGETGSPLPPEFPQESVVLGRLDPLLNLPIDIIETQNRIVITGLHGSELLDERLIRGPRS